MQARAGPGAVVEQRDDEQVAVAGAEAGLEVRQARDRGVVLGVVDDAQVVEPQVVVARDGERLVRQVEHRQHEEHERGGREPPAAKRAKARRTGDQAGDRDRHRRDPGGPADRGDVVPEEEIEDDGGEAEPEVGDLRALCLRRLGTGAAREGLEKDEAREVADPEKDEREEEPGPGDRQASAGRRLSPGGLHTGHSHLHSTPVVRPRTAEEPAGMWPALLVIRTGWVASSGSSADGVPLIVPRSSDIGSSPAGSQKAKRSSFHGSASLL